MNRKSSLYPQRTDLLDTEIVLDCYRFLQIEIFALRWRHLAAPADHSPETSETLEIL
jgi:hypothetical protein